MLIQKLSQGAELGFGLVSAPAGYGKSTLISAWLSRARIPAAWLSLDDRDNDPARFLAYLAAALRIFDASIDVTPGNKTHFGHPSAGEEALTHLINRLAQVKQQCCLVLDDYHVIQNQAVHQIVRFLLEHRPATFYLLVATRADPPLSLAKHRARSKLLELRLADLCFTPQEAAEFLNRTMSLKISFEDVVQITRRTEGWIAGLQMAALSMQNTEDISGFITAFSGSHYSIFDFLLEEILERQPPEVRRFLFYTSILNQLTAPLCDALLTGEQDTAGEPGSAPAHPAEEILKELDQANLFILPLDQDRRWYRYHHLFSDLLRLMLDKAYPGLSSELHRRACRWYEAQSMPSEALHHAISSGDMHLVAQVISANVLVLVESNEIGPILAKIDSIPLSEMIALPWLGIARAWALGVGQIKKSLQVLDAVEKSIELAPETPENQRLKGHIAAARAFVVGGLGDWQAAIGYARQAIKLLPPDEIAVRVMNLSILGDLLTAKGEVDKALPLLEEALALARTANRAPMALMAMSSLATMHLFAGRLHLLQRVCLEGLAIAEDYQQRFQHPLSATAEVFALLSRVHAEWGENEVAITYAQKGLELSERWGRINTELICLDYLGRALVYSGDQAQAYQVMERADTLAQTVSLPYWQTHAFYILESMLDCETPDAGAITRLMQRIDESKARYPALVKARLLLRDHRPDQALDALEQAKAEPSGQLLFDQVRIAALSALTYQAKGDEVRALAELRQALELGEAENRVATFMRERDAMEKLLRLPAVRSIAPEFVKRVLAACETRRKSKPAPPTLTEGLVEPLSQREREILKLLAEGCSDKKIAATLVIAPETVHKHLKNIYGKLDVHSRTEAIARANSLRLL